MDEGAEVEYIQRLFLFGDTMNENKVYYCLKVGEGYASKYYKQWSVGASPFEYDPSGYLRHELTLSEAKNGAKSIKKWYGYENIEFKILKITETRIVEEM